MSFHFPTQKTRNVIAERDLLWATLVTEIPKAGPVSRIACRRSAGPMMELVGSYRAWNAIRLRETVQWAGNLDPSGSLIVPWYAQDFGQAGHLRIQKMRC